VKKVSPQFTELELPGVILIEPQIFNDPRGFFLEAYHGERYGKAGIMGPFVQDNHSHSRKATLRGLHYQLKSPQGKLIYVVSGSIFDVAVDIRKGSPHFGKWVGVSLSSENRRQLFVPGGFAHGFCVLSDEVDVIYKCTDFYAPDDEFGILWSDEVLGVDWPIPDPVLSDKDSGNVRLADIPEEHLPVYLG
jgi:dTDP-4-dehydrorhamnose 3,5-epimerase